MSRYYYNAILVTEGTEPTECLHFNRYLGVLGVLRGKRNVLCCRQCLAHTLDRLADCLIRAEDRRPGDNIGCAGAHHLSQVVLVYPAIDLHMHMAQAARSEHVPQPSELV